MGIIAHLNKPTSLELKQFDLHHMAETETAMHNSSKVKIRSKNPRPWGIRRLISIPVETFREKKMSAGN